MHLDELSEIVVGRDVFVGNEREGLEVVLRDFLCDVGFYFGEIPVPLKVLVRIFRVFRSRLPNLLKASGVFGSNRFRFIVHAFDDGYALVHGLADSLYRRVHPLPAFAPVVRVQIPNRPV